MIQLGNTGIGKIYLGETEIAKAYLGEELVYDGGGGPTPPTPVEYSVTVTEGKYINSGGSISTTANFYYTSALQVYSGQAVVFKCYGGAATAVISTYDGTSYQPKVTGSGSSSYKTYTWTATSDCMVVFSAKKGATDPEATVNGINVTFNGFS